MSDVGKGKASDELHEYELWQDGMVVASVSASNEEDALREIMHYALVYAQDGPCEVRPAEQKQ